MVQTLWSQGKKVVEGVNDLIIRHELQDVLSTAGKDCWSFLMFKDAASCSQWELKTLFLQEVFSRGILTLGSHNMSYAHSDRDIERLLQAYNEVFAIIKEVLVKGNLKAWLKTDSLVPLFKIR